MQNFFRLSSPFNVTSPRKPNQEYIRDMFDGMAKRYDIFTQLTGFGQAQRWRKIALESVKPGMRVLDLASGTGDLALEAIRRVGASGEVVALDFSQSMLDVANNRYHAIQPTPAGSWRLVHARAESLPIDNRPFDCIVSGFALRNFYENIETILRGVYASLKPGGQIAFLDLTQPQHPALGWLWRAYMLTFVACYGAILFGKKYPIPYLPDSTRRFVDAEKFVKLLRRAGFDKIRTKTFLLGSVTLYQATRYL